MKDPQADASALIDTALAQLDAGLTSLGVKLPL